MAIKISNTTVIDNNLFTTFLSTLSCSYLTTIFKTVSSISCRFSHNYLTLFKRGLFLLAEALAFLVELTRMVPALSL